jgi:phytoene dehydrogenase-like protein
MSESKLVVTKVIKATPEEVFEAFTNPEIMTEWFYGVEEWSVEVSNTLEVGGSFTLDMIKTDGKKYRHTGEYKVIAPPEKLVFTWNSDFAQNTVVTVDFRGVADGTEITAPVIVSNINAKRLYLEKIGEEHLPWLARYGVKSYKISVSAPMINVGLDYRPPLDAHHTLITETMDKMNEYWFGDMQKGLLPKETFGLVCFPTFSDPSMAPEGHHVLNIVQSGPYHVREIDWDRDKKAYGERQLELLSERAIPGLADHVQVMDVLTPRDYERHLLTPEGAILGLDMDLPTSTVFRPAARSRSIRGLYLTGASTHPGGGLPSVVASGIIASDLVDKYE